MMTRKILMTSALALTVMLGVAPVQPAATGYFHALPSLSCKDLARPDGATRTRDGASGA
jgi:hypothetical protein